MGGLMSDCRYLQSSTMGCDGCFNVVRFLDEKIRGSPLYIHKLKDFNDCISYCSLSDISCTGCTWSWSNRSTRQRRIVGMLDRILCNDSWIDKLPESAYTYLCTSSSDHTPCYCISRLLLILVQCHSDFIITGWSVKNFHLFYRIHGAISIPGILYTN